MIIVNFFDYLKEHKSINLDKTDIGKVLQKLPIELSKKGPWLAGGCLRRIFSHEPLESGDFDFFFRNRKQYRAFSRKLMKDPGFTLVQAEETRFARSFFIELKKKEMMRTVQAVKLNYFQTLEEHLEDFDTPICQLGFDGENLIMGDTTLWDIKTKELTFTKVTHSIFYRAKKFKHLGYNVSQYELDEIKKNLPEHGPYSFEAGCTYAQL